MKVGLSGTQQPLPPHFCPAPQSPSPLQSLVLFNSDFVLYHADCLARQLKQESAAISQCVASAYRRVLQREPGNFELSRMQAYAEAHGLAATCRLLFNTNEFLYVE